jgi:hypothetical protein
MFGGRQAKGEKMAHKLEHGDHGPAVKELQREVNKQLKNREFPWRVIRTDGDFGDNTETACHFTGWILGFSPSQLAKIHDGTITAHACAILLHEKARSDAMKKRERERRRTVKKLRFLHHHPQKGGRGVATFDGVQVAAWTVKWLKKSRENGWRGEVTSGYRTPKHSEDVCRDICGQPSCPGLCAGRSSNHSGKDFPAGAIDLTDEFTFAAIQPRIGSPLKNDVPTDRIHFSVSGH